MATIQIETTLDVVEKQKELAAALLGEDSITARKQMMMIVQHI